VPAYIFDSSAIVKRYVNEQGSAWVAATVDPNSHPHIYLAAITGVEVVATFARKLKGHHLSTLDAAAAVSRFRHDFANEYRTIVISDAVVTRSMAMAEAHALRGYDAVQLGAALEVDVRRVAFGATTPLTLLTADGDLLKAAAAEGLLTDNPNTH
jgi:predicted nucleic acid-binding protein